MEFRTIIPHICNVFSLPISFPFSKNYFLNSFSDSSFINHLGARYTNFNITVSTLKGALSGGDRHVNKQLQSIVLRLQDCGIKIKEN